MKATGRTIVFGTREALTYCSTFAFDSKCGMPVFRSAEATLDRTTCLTDAAFAASIAVVPCRTSFSGWTEKSGSNGVVTTKKPSTFRRSGASVQLRGASREADHSMSSLEETPCDRAALLSRRPRHQNRLRLRHAIVSRSSNVRSTCRLDPARTTPRVQVPEEIQDRDVPRALPDNARVGIRPTGGRAPFSGGADG